MIEPVITSQANEVIEERAIAPLVSCSVRLRHQMLPSLVMHTTRTMLRATCSWINAFRPTFAALPAHLPLLLGATTCRARLPLRPALTWAACEEFDALPFFPCAPTGGGFLHTTTPLLYAHWFAGKKMRHRYARERRYHAKMQVSTYGRNNYSRKWYRKTNRWNYVQKHKDML